MFDLYDHYAACCVPISCPPPPSGSWVKPDTSQTLSTCFDSVFKTGSEFSHLVSFLEVFIDDKLKREKDSCLNKLEISRSTEENLSDKRVTHWFIVAHTISGLVICGICLSVCCGGLVYRGKTP